MEIANHWIHWGFHYFLNRANENGSDALDVKFASDFVIFIFINQIQCERVRWQKFIILIILRAGVAVRGAAND